MISTADGDWLVPFKGRNPSGVVRQNFLWNHSNIYVMDNHRAAMWCWLQKITPTESHSLMHIDWHTDTWQSQMPAWLQALPNQLDNISIQDYLGLTYRLKGHPDPFPLFRWDNYLSIYLERYGNSLKRCFFVTHDDGDPPNHSCFPGAFWDVPENLAGWLEPTCKPWIVNLDLDYFFWHDKERPGVMASEDYLRRCGEALSARLQDGTIGVLTIALTPDAGITGGWAPSENVARLLLSTVGIDFNLP